GHWLRPGRVLVIAQVGICLVLLFGAGVFVRSLRGIDAQDGGFDRERVLIVRVEPRGSDQRGIPGTSQRLDRIYRDLISRVRAIPGVRSATMAHFGPTAEVYYSQANLLPSGEVKRIPTLMVYPGYFETMGIPIRAGRDLEEHDLAAESEQVALVN